MLAKIPQKSPHCLNPIYTFYVFIGIAHKDEFHLDVTHQRTDSVITSSGMTTVVGTLAGVNLHRRVDYKGKDLLLHSKLGEVRYLTSILCYNRVKTIP